MSSVIHAAPDRCWKAHASALVVASAFLAERRFAACDKEPAKSSGRWFERGKYADDDSAKHEMLCAEIVGAIRAESAGVVLHALMGMPSIDTPVTSSGSTALAVACSVGDIKLVNALLTKKKADPGAMDFNGTSCVAKACAEGHLKIVRRLYRDERVDLRLADKFGLAPIHHAIGAGHLEVAQYLLDASVNSMSPTLETEGFPGVKERRNDSPLHVAARRLSIPATLLHEPQRYDAFRLLLSYKADPTRANQLGDSVLHVLARQGDTVGLWLILAGDVDVSGALDARNHAGVSVLQEVDEGSLTCSIAMRLAKILPQQSRDWILTVMFNDGLNVLWS